MTLITSAGCVYTAYDLLKRMEALTIRRSIVVAPQRETGRRALVNFEGLAAVFRSMHSDLTKNKCR